MPEKIRSRVFATRLRSVRRPTPEVADHFAVPFYLWCRPLTIFDVGVFQRDSVPRDPTEARLPVGLETLEPRGALTPGVLEQLWLRLGS
jgi:hypothetical protein